MSRNSIFKYGDLWKTWHTTVHFLGFNKCVTFQLSLTFLCYNCLIWCIRLICVCVCVFVCVCACRLGRRRALLMSVSLSGLLGVAVCVSNSPVAFLLLRLSQGAMLAGVFLSSYIAREFPLTLHPSTCTSHPSPFNMHLTPFVRLCHSLIVTNTVLTSYWAWIIKMGHQPAGLTGVTHAMVTSQGAVMDNWRRFLRTSYWLCLTLNARVPTHCWCFHLVWSGWTL